MNLEAFVSHVVAALGNARLTNEPYGHAVIDNFLPEDVATGLLPHLDAVGLPCFTYDSPIERKEATNQWNEFAPQIYAVLAALNHYHITQSVNRLLGTTDLFMDAGLHGGGIHRTRAGGRLNLHIDYAIHPKLIAERRANLIIYLNPQWDNAWGGHLELWSGDTQPETQIVTVAPTWNRAVLFETSDHSWHGFPEPLRCPNGVARHSLAVYYCSFVRPTTKPRYKAQFVPAPDQLSDVAIQELCERRANAESAAEAYRDNR